MRVVSRETAYYLFLDRPGFGWISAFGSLRGVQALWPRKTISTPSATPLGVYGVFRPCGQEKLHLRLHLVILIIIFIFVVIKVMATNVFGLENGVPC